MSSAACRVLLRRTRLRRFMSGPNMSTRSSGKPAAKQTTPTPATPYDFKRETKQVTIGRLRTQRGARGVLLSVVCCLLSVVEEDGIRGSGVRLARASFQSTAKGGCLGDEGIKRFSCQQGTRDRPLRQTPDEKALWKKRAKDMQTAY